MVEKPETCWHKDIAVHEMSMAQSLLEIVLEEGKKHKLERVKAIRLRIGALAAVVPESLRFCLELLSEKTIASGASLEIETVPVVARCSECGDLFEVENHVFICPQCGEPALDLVSGRELSIVNIEGERGEDYDADQDSCGPQHPASQ